MVREPELTLGDRLRKARISAGLEQADLARACGVSRPLISRWEHDHSVPDVNQALRWAEATGVSFGWLCGVPTRSRCFSESMLVGEVVGWQISDVPMPIATEAVAA